MRKNNQHPRKFVEHALLLDALSGEFYPPSDKQKRAHSLSRLVVATTLKGVPIDGAGLDIYVYRPSWASESSSKVSIINRQSSQSLQSLTLEDESGDNPVSHRTFKLATRLMSEEIAKLEIIDDAEKIVEVLKLRLGPETNTNRNTVAEIAQEFYNNYELDEPRARR